LFWIISMMAAACRHLCRVLVDGPRVHQVFRTKAVHVDAAVGVQLGGELGRQRGVVLRVEVAQGVAQGQLLLLGA
jgi:hypothetical protein